MQQYAQLLAAHIATAFQVIFQQQHPILVLLVKATMSDEVKDVAVAFPQPVPQRCRCGFLQPFQDHEPGLLLLAQSIPESVPFLLDIEIIEPGWGGNHHQHPQGRRRAEGRDALFKVQVAHHGGVYAQAEKAAFLGVVQVLPRYVGQLGGIDQPNPEPHPGTPFPPRLFLADAQAALHPAVEDGLKEPSTKCLDLLQRRLALSERVSPDLTAGLADVQQNVLQLLQVGKRKVKLDMSLARTRHIGAVPRLVGPDLQVEVQVGLLSHDHLLPPASCLLAQKSARHASANRDHPQRRRVKGQSTVVHSSSRWRRALCASRLPWPVKAIPETPPMGVGRSTAR